MAQIKLVSKDIMDLQIGAKVVIADKESGDNMVVTHVAFNVADPPGQFNDILMAMASNFAVDVTFDCAQTKLEGV